MERFNAMSGKGKAGVGCLAIVLLMVICGSCTSMFGGGDDDGAADEPAATVAVAEDTAEPESAEATDAPAATDTDEPTDEPDATETPGFSPEVKEYMSWLAVQFGVVGQVTTGIGAELGKLGETPALILSSEFKTGLGTQLGILTALARDMKEKEDVPPEAAVVHVDVLRLADNLERAASLYAQGVDQVDAEQFTEANALMTESGELIGNISKTMEEMQP